MRISRIFRRFCISLLCIGFSTGVVFASATNGTIDPLHHYAWSTDFGWFNFAASQSDIHVTDMELTGYIWNQNVGWINLSPTNSGQGVLNDGAGHLSGSAWAEGAGWFDFSHITIDASGVFHGISANIGGSFTFDCDQCSVVTDWRPASTRGTTPTSSPTGSSGGTGGSGAVGASPTPSKSPALVSSPTPTISPRVAQVYPSPTPTSGLIPVLFPSSCSGWFACLWMFIVRIFSAVVRFF